MASNLPGKENQAKTYLEALPFLEDLIASRLVKGETERQTFRIWNDILAQYFPGRENYSLGPELSPESGRAALFTAHLIPEAGWEEKFIVVECLAPGLETEEFAWQDAFNKLGQDLVGVSGQHRKYGVVAIGSCVRLYEWRDGQLFNIADGQTFYLDRQCRAITEQLLYFRENH
ncbi:hypothetical protein Hte_010567 [Hypoxylon texense]